MKPILITETNAEAIEFALTAVNGRATAHCYTTFGEIRAEAERAERKLSDLLEARSKHVGARYVSQSGGRVASSYRRSRVVTRITLKRGAKGWYLEAVKQGLLWPNETGGAYLRLTPAQDCAIVAAIRQRYTVEA